MSSFCTRPHFRPAREREKEREKGRKKEEKERKRKGNELFG